jgi:hypothetical protein
MANWEYKVLSGGKMGLGSMAMLEQFLNELGQQQWEVISWQTDPETPLKFTGLARRPIVRDIAPGEMPAAMDKEAIAAAKEEAEREREAWVETLAREREFYAKSIEEEGSQEDEDDESDLASALIDRIRPMMKRNQRGPGAAGSVTYLAKKLDKAEEDLIGALAEAGLELEDDETDSKPLEHGSEMLWLNSNSRGEVWINSMPKSRYRRPQPRKQAEDSRPAGSEQPADGGAPRESAAQQPAPLPEGTALLARLRPMMRRNRGGRGLSGSLPFLSRALRQSEESLAAALATLGLALPEDPNAEPAPVEIEGHEYFLNKNEKGQVWINAREKGAADAGLAAETAPAAASESPPVLNESPASEVAPAATASRADVSAESVLELALPQLAKAGRSATAASKVADVAGALGVPQATLIDALVDAGLTVPIEAGEKPVFAEAEGSRFWLSRGEDETLSLNAKPSRRPRTRRKD